MYKRQYFLSTFFYKERWVTKRIFTWILLLTTCLESVVGISVYTVSYTHLDVYKRQIALRRVIGFGYDVLCPHRQIGKGFALAVL